MPNRARSKPSSSRACQPESGVVHACVAGVDEMLVWQQVPSGEVGVASWHGVDVGGGGDRDGDMHDQVGPVGLAGLGEVGLRQEPSRSATQALRRPGLPTPPAASWSPVRTDCTLSPQQTISSYDS
jgi:hypothetical protein